MSRKILQKISITLLMVLILQVLSINISLAFGEIDISDNPLLEVQILDQEFTGKIIEPEVIVKYNDENLILGEDYTVEYYNNKDIGIAAAIITGIGNYTGEHTENFEIIKKDINNLKINTTQYYTYTGKAIKSYITLYNNDVKLKYNKDYTIDFSKNINTGKAKAKIKGIGNYTGTKTTYYYIIPKKAKINNIIMNDSKTQATINWEKDKQASGYIIYQATSRDGNYKKIKNISDRNRTQYKAKNLNKKKTYYFKIRSYKLVDNKRKYSQKYSNPKTNEGLIAEITLTSTSNSYNRNINLRQASKAINGLKLKPGESFNWFKVVGPTSAKKGYKVAAIFKNKKHAMGMGGGICQVSTTLYQASLKAKLKIVERHQHSLPVTYTTLGKDATVTYGANNLIVRNNKKFAIKFVTYSKGRSTTCKIYRVNY